MLVKSNLKTIDKPLWEINADGVLAIVAAKKKAADEEEEEQEEAGDDWEKDSAEEPWDPDFDEFDVPKSRTGKSDNKEEEELNFDEEEEFNDLFEDDAFEDDASGDDF